MAGDNGNATEKKRRPGWVQGLDLLLRTWHIGATSIIFGGAVCGASFLEILAWHNLAIASGCALMISRFCQSRHWPYQVRGILSITHVGLLWIVHLHSERMVPVLVPVLILGVFAGNLPGYIKQWSVVHWQRIE